MKKETKIVLIIAVAALAAVSALPSLLSGNDGGKESLASPLLWQGGSGVPPTEFVKGLDDYKTYSAASSVSNGTVFSFSSHGKNFTLTLLQYIGGIVVAVDDGERNRDIIFRNGKLDMPSRVDYSYPRIGFDEGTESPSNRYLVGCHDFTEDGNKELVLCVDDGADGIAIFVLDYNRMWYPIGEIVSKGKGLGGGRVFRQAITLKGENGTLYSWTFHNDRFDFLASDHSTDPRLLF